MSDLFISYAREDQSFVLQLEEALNARGKQAWIDWQSIPPAADFPTEIQAGIESSDSFVFILSPDSISSPWCLRELEHACKNKKLLLPVLRRELDGNPAPEALVPLNWIYFREKDEFDRAVNALIQAQEADLEYTRAHTRLLTRAVEWDHAGRDSSFTLRGKDLQEARAWLAVSEGGKEPQPSALQTQYILTSQQDAIRRQRRAMAAVTFGLVVAVVLAVAALIQYRIANENARRSRAGELAAESALLFETRPDTANLLGIEAHRTFPTFDTFHNLLTFWSGNPGLRSSLYVGADAITALAYDDHGNLWMAKRDGSSIDLSSPDLGTSSYGHLDSQAIPIEQLSFSPGAGLLFVLGCGDHTGVDDTCIVHLLEVWDLSNRQRRSFTQISTTSGVFTRAVSPDGKFLATGDALGEVLLWDARSGRLLAERPYNFNGITALAFSPDSSSLAAGYEDGSLRLWDFTTGQPEPANPDLDLAFQEQGQEIYQLVYTPDGKHLVSSGYNLLRLWDARDGSLIGEPFGDQIPDVHNLAFSSKGRYLVIADCGDPVPGAFCQQGQVEIFDVESGAKTATFTNGQNGAIWAIALSPDNLRLASTSEDGSIRIWDTRPTWQLNHSLADLGDMAFSPDRKILALAGCAALENYQCTRGQIEFWETGTFKRLSVSTDLDSDWILNLAYSPDGSLLAISSLDGTVRFWEAASQSLRPAAITTQVEAMVFSLDGSLLYTADRNSGLTTWDVATGQEKWRSSSLPEGIYRLAVEPSGARFALGGAEEMLQVWVAGEGKPAWERSTRGANNLYALAFSSDGKILAAGGCQHPDPLQFCHRGAIQFWNALTGSPLGESLAAHLNFVHSLAFSPDGSLLASGGCAEGGGGDSCEVGEVLLWDVKTRRQIGVPLTYPTDFVIHLAFSPDGDWLLSASRADVVRARPVAPGLLAEQICSRSGRNFTQAEWQRYFPDEPYRKTCEQWPPGE